MAVRELFRVAHHLALFSPHRYRRLASDFLCLFDDQIFGLHSIPTTLPKVRFCDFAFLCLDRRL